MQSAALHRKLQHSFLQQKCFYDEQCAPLFRSLHPNTLEWILGPRLASLARNSNIIDHYAANHPRQGRHGEAVINLLSSSMSKAAAVTTATPFGEVYGSMRQAIDGNNRMYAVMQQLKEEVLLRRDSQTNAATFPPVSSTNKKRGGKPDVRKTKKSNVSSSASALSLPSNLIDVFAQDEAHIATALPTTPGEDPRLLIDGLKWITNAQKRLEASRLRSFTHQNYEFEVGDVVYQQHLGQVGVVADRLPVCFESDEWITEQLSSTSDTRLRHPWYFILVASHRDLPVDMTRYGSSLSHVKVTKKMSIGFHSLLPIYFERYDHTTGKYIPRKDGKALFARRQLAAMEKALSSSFLSSSFSETPASSSSSSAFVSRLLVEGISKNGAAKANRTSIGAILSERGADGKAGGDFTESGKSVEEGQ